VSKQEAGKPRADDTQAHAGLANEIRGTVGEVCGGASTARIDIHHHELGRPGSADQPCDGREDTVTLPRRRKNGQIKPRRKARERASDARERIIAARDDGAWKPASTAQSSISTKQAIVV
jgi:hypothetical protein